jgi:hypothetical protein
MNIGYVTMEKFQLCELCEKALKKIKPHSYNTLYSLQNRKLYKRIEAIKNCAETFGVKSDIMIDIELFNAIQSLVGE